MFFFLFYADYNRIMESRGKYMEEQIFGRKEEKELLSDIYQNINPAFIAVYGRRRIGKTFLIKKFFEDKKGTFFHLTGMQSGSMKEQLLNFVNVIQQTFKLSKPITTPTSWLAAFHLLFQSIKRLPPKAKTVIFLDELPWLASPKSRCLQALDYYWNQYFSSMNNLVLVVCGSAASWMIDNIINNKGGLYGRVTHEIHLMPFTFGETVSFLEKKRLRFDLKEAADLYMILGGVAKYLEYITPGLSVSQVISKLCFNSKGPLSTEFKRLYQSLFNSHEQHINIVRALAKRRGGFTYGELAKQLKASPGGGTLTRHLNELCLSGFIKKMPVFGRGSKKIGRYILVDEYSLFYLFWIENVSPADLDSREIDYWIKQSKTPKYWSWRGLSFELICFKHIYEIKKALGIGSVITRTTKWHYESKDCGEKGTEIDLVIERDDGWALLHKSPE